MAILTRPGDAEFRLFFAGYGRGDLTSVRGIEGGTVNSSFEVAINKTPYFLRIYEEQGFQGAQEEAELLLRLASRGVKTPRPIANAQGTYVAPLSGKPAAVFEWSPGTMRCQRSVTANDTRRLGEALARFHCASADEPLRKGRFDVDALFVRLERVGAVEPVVAERLRGGLERYCKVRRPLPVGLIHGDLFRDNVLWSNEELSSLIDFESASSGPLAYDVMVTLLAWCFGDRLDHTLARSLIAGYTKVRPLSEEEQAGLFVEGAIACHRFAITRITDNAIRIGKDYRRFVARLEALEALGENGVRALCGAET